MNQLQEKIAAIKTDIREANIQSLWLNYRTWLIGLGLSIIIITGLGVYLTTQFFAVPNNPNIIDNQGTTEETLALASPESMSISETVTSAISESEQVSTSTAVVDEAVTWYVDLKGAVKRPQVVPVTPGMRIHDVIDIAGGLAEDADQSQVNLAQLVADQMVIYVPKHGEEIAENVATTIETSKIESEVGQEEGSELVNINTAMAEELQTLSGIGEKRAADIILYRETNGAFESVDDLDQVSGIGEKTMEKLRPLIRVN